MAAPIDQWIAVRLMVTDETPDDDVKYGGLVLALPPEQEADMVAATPTNPGRLVGVRGYHEAGGPTGHQWFMTDAVTKAFASSIARIPGPNGWAKQSSERTFRQIGRTLVRDYNVPGAEVLSMLQQLHDAVADNLTKKPKTVQR